MEHDGGAGYLVPIENNTYKSSTHVLDLPEELLRLIFSYVASTHLDMRSLDRCAAVCKLFYFVARDEHIWRKACEV